MNAYIFSVQYISKDNNFEVAIDRGIVFGASYTEVVKRIEAQKGTDGNSIVDLYIVILDKGIIPLTEDTYEKLLNGDTI